MSENEYYPFMGHHTSKFSFKFLKNRKKLTSCLLATVIIGVLAILLFAALFVMLYIFLFSFGDQSIGNRLTLNDIFNSSLKLKTYDGFWAQRSIDSKDFLISSQNGLQIFDIAANITDTLISNKDFNELKAEKWWLSPSFKFLLLAINVTPLYRHSFHADYFIFSIENISSVAIPNDTINNAKWRLVKWAGLDDVLILSSGSALFSINNIIDIFNITELYSSKAGEFIGTPDWVYEEEVFSSDSAVWESRGSPPMLVFCIFNTNLIQKIILTKYGNSSNTYPTYEEIKYPKSGQVGSEVSIIMMSSINATNNCTIQPPSGYFYIQNVHWINTTSTVIMFLNRAQNKTVLCIYNAECVCQCVNSIESSAWIATNVFQPVFRSDDSVTSPPTVYVIAPHTATLNDITDNYTQVISLGSLAGSTYIPLTAQSTDVRRIVVVYSSPVNTDYIFYLSGDYSYQTHLYYVTNKNTTIVCVTCNMKETLYGYDIADRNCQVFSVSFAKSASYFQLNCLGPDLPYSLLCSTERLIIEGIQNMLLKVLKNNTNINLLLNRIALPTVKPFSVPTTNPINGNTNLYGTITLPPAFSETKQYNALIYVYGGPNSQLASLLHPLYPYSGFIAYLSSAFDFVVVTIEGRGTCCRGDQFRFSVYKQLGVLETEDQVTVINHLSSLDFVKSVSIMGASYGGYMSGMVLANASSIIQSAIVQSPVTDWRYYDSIYTERYMGTPADNPNGYLISSLVKNSATVDGSKLLLIHGSADDNVHYQNSAELSLSLKLHGAQYIMHTYFDENHSLAHTGTRLHLFKLISNFLQREMCQL